MIFAPMLLGTRKLIVSIKWDMPNLAKQYFVGKFIHKMEFVMTWIYHCWPTPWRTRRYVNVRGVETNQVG